MKKLAYIIIALISLSKYSHAQSRGSSYERDLFFAGYEVAIPTNSTYLTETSWSGARFDYRHMIKSNVSIGIGVSYNSFNQYFTKQTYQKEDGSGAITSDMIRRVYTSPITVSAHYYLEGNKMVKPYVGLGLGTEYSEQNAYFNIYEVYSRNWGFVMRPEIGLIAKFNPGIGGFVSAAYNYATNSNDSFHIDHLSQFPITIGLIFSTR